MREDEQTGLLWFVGAVVIVFAYMVGMCALMPLMWAEDGVRWMMKKCVHDSR